MLNTCADGRGLTRAVNNLFTDTVQLYRMLVYRYNSTSTDTGSVSSQRGIGDFSCAHAQSSMLLV